MNILSLKKVPDLFWTAPTPFTFKPPAISVLFLLLGLIVFGFGHAVLRTEDPRAAAQFALGEEICPEDEYFKTIRTLREVAPRVLSENPKIRNPNANVDIASGTLLNFVGLEDAEYYTTFFGWARVAGIGAQIVDERTIMRDGRGIPIYRPKYIAESQSLRHVE